MTAIVNGLGNEYKDRVQVSIEDATKPENAARIKNEFGFRNHGLVIYDNQGHLAQKLDGHLLSEPQIRGAIETVLSGSSPESSSTGG